MRKVAAAIVLLLALGLSAYLFTYKMREHFGMSPGTVVQLQASHVPTEDDYNYDYPKKLPRDIRPLTWGDPGGLQPWYFLWGTAPNHPYSISRSRGNSHRRARVYHS